MAVVAAQSIDWANPSIMPQGQVVEFVVADMNAVPVMMTGVVAAPDVYGTVVPAPTITDMFFGSLA